jgi:hypothetical protein
MPRRSAKSKGSRTSTSTNSNIGTRQRSISSSRSSERLTLLDAINRRLIGNRGNQASNNSAIARSMATGPRGGVRAWRSHTGKSRGGKGG